MVRVAIVGCGSMGKTHSNSYHHIDGVRVVAVCDLLAERGRPVAESFRVTWYDRFDTMLAQGGFEVVDICLPTYLHREFALKAMRAGKHVFCEKPIALSVDDANEMVATAQACGVKFSVGHVVRFFPAYQQAAALAASGRLGLPRLIRTTRNQAFPGWSWENWYHDYAKSGGLEIDLVIHDFDWIIHYFGDVERVYAKDFGGKVANQEHCMCILRLRNGAIAHVEGSWAFPSGTAFRTTFEVVGTKAQVEYDSVLGSPIVKQTNTQGVHQVAYGNPMLGDMDPYTAQLRQFVEAVAGDRPPMVTGAEAVKALRVSLAAIESARTGRCVVIGEER